MNSFFRQPKRGFVLMQNNKCIKCFSSFMYMTLTIMLCSACIMPLIVPISHDAAGWLASNEFVRWAPWLGKDADVVYQVGRAWNRTQRLPWNEFSRRAARKWSRTLMNSNEIAHRAAWLGECPTSAWRYTRAMTNGVERFNSPERHRMR